MISRRNILLSGAALAALPRSANAQSSSITLEPKKGLARLAPDDLPETPIWGYGGKVPGPEIRVMQGGQVSATLSNGLAQPTTVHWHGIRINNAMDGVTALTQKAVQPGQSFDYRFTAPDAGTFWYHPHNRTWEQMARGLYGPLIVEEKNPPRYDRDLVLMLDDWRLNEDGAIDGASFGSLHDWSHSGRLGNWPTVNGRPQPEYPVRQNERLRLRLINAANASVLVLRLNGMDAQIVAHDGMPIIPKKLTGTIFLAPAQRIDLIVDVTDAAKASLMLTGRESFEACSFPVEGALRDAPLTDPVALPPNPLNTKVDLANAVRATLTIEGGAMSGLAEARIGGFGARYRGETESEGPVPIRAMASSRGLVWAMNGVAGMPLDPFFSVKAGQTVIVKIVNEGAWPHAMHFHGHHFRETRDGAPWRDTLLLTRNKTKEIAFVADNPGRWMLHCHMLEHQAGGMATWFEVT